jgi:hypothetical protein
LLRPVYKTVDVAGNDDHAFTEFKVDLLWNQLSKRLSQRLRPPRNTRNLNDGSSTGIACTGIPIAVVKRESKICVFEPELLLSERWLHCRPVCTKSPRLYRKKVRLYKYKLTCRLEKRTYCLPIISDF